ncbi:MAG TPA: glycoside hydrolase family 2 TIM barrel-domain containing protein [Gemmatimonadaceae bacterium]|nr:glycoside hydrolase family 2 TIM barrel-domain containing protein [Gemmatimonadaceae bacterium]
MTENDAETMAYPRPLLRRKRWSSLNGMWQFAIDADAVWREPGSVEWTQNIEVPFAPETKRSGVHQTGLFSAVWYRRELVVEDIPDGERLMLRFGAVDYHTTVWLDNIRIGEHEGGYTPFSFDISELVRAGHRTLTVRAYDNPHDLEQPRGKQDWELQPHLIWYPRTTGIWQTVWLEPLPSSFIDQVLFTPNMDRWEIAMHVTIEGRAQSPLSLNVRLQVGDMLLAHDRYLVLGQIVHRRIALSDPGIDDSRNDLLWSPSSPTLIDVFMELRDADGNVVDEVHTYTALREIATQGDRVILNGRAYRLRMVLDQGYWPDSGMTPPDDLALRRDVELTKAMGFNGVRKHQKIEDPRYLYWCDRLGLLVWEEMPSAYRFTAKSVRRLQKEWEEVITRDVSHACVAAWVPFNESWGVPNLPNSAAERHYVQALYHLTKTLDPTRPVIGNDGWESVATDIIGIHDYDSDPTRIARRYHTSDARLRLFQHERPGGRLLRIGENTGPDHPIVLSEFGGIAVLEQDSWGYSVANTAEELAERYAQLLWVISGLQMLAGFCYTQFADTYQERNGLLHADRRPKFPLADIAEATVGERPPRSWATSSPTRSA